MCLVAFPKLLCVQTCSKEKRTVINTKEQRGLNYRDSHGRVHDAPPRGDRWVAIPLLVLSLNV